MRLRVAKKVHLGRSCTGANCHRRSTILEAEYRIGRAFIMRKYGPRSFVPARHRSTFEHWGCKPGDVYIGSRLLKGFAAYQLFTNVTVDWEGHIGSFEIKPAFDDPHGVRRGEVRRGGLKCGACGAGRHTDCSGWCRCGCGNG